jgi:GalNAc-alpha-(1->4)-GalNAc-alpha-(1->3)-diNAcBac-PP-undecaprenol alpha-1,4-N-acetyl-D-galactosaminyltransferase
MSPDCSAPIIIVIPSLFGGGAERVASILAAEFSKYERTILITFKGNTLESYKLPQNVEMFSMHEEYSRTSYVFRPLRRIFRILRIINGYQNPRLLSLLESANLPTLIAGLLLRIVGKKLRISVSVRNNPRFVHLIHKWFCFILYPFADNVICLSRGVLNDPAWQLSYLCNKIFLPNPVVINPELKSYNCGFLFKTDRPFIFTAGRLVNQKNHIYLINCYVASRLWQTHDLLIFGDGPKRDSLIAKIKATNMTRFIQLKGRFNDLMPVFKAADAFVLSSTYEGLGNVILESMAANCLAISVDCDYGPRELIGDNHQRGILCDGENSLSLIGGLNALSALSPEQRGLMTNAAYQFVKSNHDSLIVCREWMREI